MWLSYANIRTGKAKISQERNSELWKRKISTSFTKINNSQFNGQPDYIFESSAPMAHLAIDMDQDSLEHPL